jgi:2-C-methyl-D-erythritol 4-phosphate cytidylyltransferase
VTEREAAAAVVLASGAGTRVGAGVNKVYLPLSGRRLLAWSLEAFGHTPGIGTLVLVTRPQDAELAAEVLQAYGGVVPVEIVHGGATRQASELQALRHLAERISSGLIDTVLLHDAARPLIGADLIVAVLSAAREYGGAVPGLVAENVVAVTGDGAQLDGKAPEGVVRVQTPQGFRALPLLAAYEQADVEGFVGTDTASCMEKFSSLPVRWVPGSEENFKITYPHDLVVAETILKSGA